MKVLDEQATANARRRHQAGVERLNEIFKFTAEAAETSRLEKRQSLGHERRQRRAANRRARQTRQKNRA